MAYGCHIPTANTAVLDNPFSFSLRPTPTPPHHRAPMATTSTSTPRTMHEPRKTCDISNLMSPPEPTKIDSFAHHGINHTGNSIDIPRSINSAMADTRRRLPGPIPPLSPPISPATKVDHQIMNPTGIATADPILYPARDLTNSPPQRPLFAREELAETQRIVSDHISARPAALFKDASPPAQDEYELLLYFQSHVMKKFTESPRSWLKREREFLIADRRAQARHMRPKLQPLLPANPQPIRKEAQRAKPARAPKVTKITLTKSATTKPAAAKSPPSRPRPIRAGPGPVPVAGVMSAAGSTMSFTKPIAARAPSSTPDPSARRGTTQTRADDDFNSVPDYCPPLDTMPGGITGLKMEWKTGTTDLSSDPHRHLLHEEEITLASSLRLTAAVYLTSKRRIFVRRLECLRVGKEFRKTDAQQACKIDVNKASKLWTAFDRIGWLDKAYVAKYL